MTKLRRSVVSASIALSAVFGLAPLSRAEPTHDGGGEHREHHVHDSPPATPITDSNSLFQLQSVFRDEEGKSFRFSQLRGGPALVVMFYGSCKTMCPVLIEDAREIDAALDANQRKRLRVVLVTLDPVRDTPERLRALATERKLERPRWSLLRGSDKDVRELSMVLGVQYRRLSGGDYAHTALLTLLDGEGRVAARIEGLRQPNAELLTVLRSLLGSPAKPAGKTK